MDTQNGRGRTRSDRSPWQCHQTISYVDLKARDTTQCWSNAKKKASLLGTARILRKVLEM